MLAPTALIAEAVAGSAGNPMNGFVQLLKGLGVNWPGLLAQMVNFSVVAFVLWRFAFKPVIATLDERQQKIAAGLKYADEMKAQLEATQEQSAEIIRQAQIQATTLVNEARQSAKVFLDKQQAEALQRASAVLAKAQQAVELEHKKMLDEARSEIARLVVVTTERVLAKKLSDADRSAYNESATRELTVL